METRGLSHTWTSTRTDSTEAGRKSVMSQFDSISVQPPCSLCLCGDSLVGIIYHRGTENTEVAQRKLKSGHTRRRDNDGSTDSFTSGAARSARGFQYATSAS